MALFTMNRSIKAVVYFSILVFLAGCSTTHSYSNYAAGGKIHQDEIWEEEKERVGYWEEKIEPGAYAVEYIGKAGDPSAVTTHWAFKRAAELAFSLGSDGFAIVGMKTRNSSFSTETTYQYLYEYETITHFLPYTLLIVLTDEFYGKGNASSPLFNAKRVLSWYEMANQRHRESNKMFDAQGIIERHFKYLSEKNVQIMRSVANNPPKDVYWWEAGIPEGKSRIFFAIDKYENTVTHIWVDKQHLIRSFEGDKFIWADVEPGEHLLEITVYVWFRKPDNPRKTIDKSITIITKEGGAYLVHCPPTFGIAKGSFKTDQQKIKAELNSEYKWE